MEEVLTSVLSPDNARRKQGEEYLETTKSEDPKKLMEDLYACMSHEQDNIANLACVLFKKYFLEGEGVDKETLQVLEQNMFNLLNFSRNTLVLHAQGGVIVRVYAKLDDVKTLLMKIIEFSKHDDAATRELAMYMLEILVDVHIPAELAKENIQDFKAIFKQGLEDAEMAVKVASLKATSSFITSLDDGDVALKLADIIQLVLNTMIEALKTNEDAGKSALESLIDMADFHPDLFKQYGSTLVSVISQIMLNKEFEDGTRSSSKEIILSLADKAPAVVRKIKEIKTEFYPALFQMITEVPYEDDLEEWANDHEEEDVTRTDPHGVAREALVRFARIIGEKVTIEASSDLIKRAITDSDWRVRQAGYFYLGYIAESCKNIFSKNLEETMKMAASGVVDEHPRVQYAGLTCLGLMLAEQAPKAQKTFHGEIMPQLMAIMNSDALLKVKAQATSAAVNFVRELIQVDEDGIEDTEKEASAIEEYTDDLLESCSKLFSEGLEHNYPALQEEVLALISCIATLIEEKFAKYYPNFMPGLKQIILNTPNETTLQKDLRSNTIQTIGFMMDAIKNNKENIHEFKEDGKEIVEIFSKLLTSGLIKDDDPQVTAITNALTQVAAVLQEDFAPFLPTIMEKLLEGTRAEVDFKLTDAELPTGELDENLTSVTFKMKGLDGQKKLSLNTTALETKINSTQVIRALAENLGTTFFPYVEKTYEAMSELFEYKYSRAVRMCAVESCQFLILACEDLELQEQLMSQLTARFDSAITNFLAKKDSEEIVVFLREYYHCIKIFKKPEPVGFVQIENLVNLMADACRLASEDKTLQVAEIEKKRDVLDDEDLDQYRDVLDEIEKVFLYTMEIAGQFMRIYKSDVTEVMKIKLFPLFVENINKSENTEHEVIDSLCFFIDCCEFLSEAFFNQIADEMAHKFAGIYDEYKDREDRDVVQSLSFGLGVIASRMTNEKFAPHAARIFHLLEEVISVEDPLSEDNNYATENALSSLLKLCYFQKDGHLIGDAQVKKYLNLLPLQNDLDEALAVNKLLIEQVEKKNPNLFGHENCNGAELEQALNRIAELHHDDPDLKTLDEETAVRFAAVLQQ